MRALICTGALAFAALGFADLRYTVSPGSSDTKLKIEIEFVANSDKTEFQIPNWAPGSYRYDDNWKRVTDAKVESADNKLETSSIGTLPVITTWSTASKPGQKVKLSYEVPVQFADGTGHYAGPSTYIYPVGRLKEKCTVKFNFKPGTPIAVGLNPIKGDSTFYAADNYDVLADNPVTYGAFTLDTYQVKGKTHYIAYRGVPKKDVDRAYVIKACKFITEMQADFFGGSVPYDRYVWHFAVNDAVDGAGGLEHLSSTQISLASGVGPGAVSVLSHEFFHLWNVKRIRSAVLGPFDYTTLPQTGALWWLEGVTDYYAHTLLGRYGWFGKNEREKDPITKLYADASQNLNAVRARTARLEVSPYESSFRVRDASNGRGNSQGYQVSYYDTGWLCGLVLDIELLDKTDGKYSLDDVERDLWDQCRDDKPGFAEDGIRSTLKKFGGYSLGTFYDQVIMKPGEIPVEAALAKIGMEIVSKDQDFPSLPFSLRGSQDDKAPRVTLSDVPGLAQGDLVLKINGESVANESLMAQLRLYRSLQRSGKPGDTVKLTVKTDAGTKEVEAKIGKVTRKVSRIESVANPSERQLKLRRLFEAKKRR